MDELLQLILSIEKRTVLYIGNTDLDNLSHFLSGYIYAKSERNKEFGKWLYDDFRAFLVDKYNDNRSFNWSHLIIANELDGSSTDAFYRLLHEYLSTLTL